MNRGGPVANTVDRPAHSKLTINIDVSFRQIRPLNSGFIKVQGDEVPFFVFGT
jgi:hypothetical protein